MRYLVLLMVSAILSIAASEWPAFKADSARSSATDEKLLFPLKAGWTYRATLSPQIAWKEPGRSINALDFDYAYQPVVSGGKIFLGSSADDSVRALDASTGQLVWQYVCSAPVRFAPHIANGLCYFASDDGCAYCVDAKNGSLIWQVRLGLDDRKLIANGRLSSRWPCRSGVLVKDGIVYVTAGMWPSEGIFIYALDANTGKEKWCNDTSSYEYIEYPHVPSASFGGPAPQGYLLADEESLIVPTGRGVPAAFDLKTGSLKFYRADSEVSHRGGTWATVFGETLFVTSVGWQPDAPPRLGESPEHPADSLGAFSTRTGREEWSLTNALKAVDPTWKQQTWRGQVRSGLLGKTRALFSSEAIYAFGNGKADAWAIDGKNVASRWSIPIGRVYAEARTPNALILGLEGRVLALSTTDGKELWQATVEGQARGIAIADGRLLVSTDRGVVQTFAREANVSDRGFDTYVSHIQPAALPATVSEALKKVKEPAGFAIVIGGKDARLAQSLARHCGLYVVSVLKDESIVQSERRRIIDDGSKYGSQVSVQLGSALELPFVPHFATFVVLNEAGSSIAEAYRILRPCGGVLCAVDGKLGTSPDIPAIEVTGGLVVRGKLQGAFDWDSKNLADERVRWPLEFQWYGGFDGQLQKARHTRPRTPIAANGRMFVFGENTVSAIDAYTGFTLWQRRLNSTVGTTALAVASDDSITIYSGTTAVRLDAATGRALEVIGDANSAPPVLNITKPIKIDGAARPGASCAIELKQTESALIITLRTQNREPARDDAWELAFDFRAPTKRLDAPGPGSFEIVVNPWAGTLRAHQTFPYPQPVIELLPGEVGNGRVQMTFKWSDLKLWLGEKPDSFAFAADCKLWHPLTQSQVLWDRPLVKGRTRWVNDAEAIVQLTPGTSAGDPGVLSPLLPIPLKSMSDIIQKDKSTSLPLNSKRRPNADLSDFGSNAPVDEKGDVSFLPRAPGYELTTRKTPFTNQSESLDYSSSYGCSGIISSAVIDFMRSGCIGVYDRADDSGMRNISGIRSGCGQTILPALGMMLYAEGTGNCLCTYNFATSLALAPSTSKRNEDWALFNEPRLESNALQHLALNFGAPGDRRDAKGVLWLGYPRQPLAVKLGNTIDLPIHMDLAPNGKPVRTNTDRRPVTGTERPWIYGSAIMGLRRLHLDMQFYKPGGLCLSVGAKEPAIDGELTDACWDGFGGAPTGKGSSIWIRHDVNNLYVAANTQTKTGSWSTTLGDSSGLVMIQVNANSGGKVDAQVSDLRMALARADKSLDSSATLIDLGGGAEIRAGWTAEGLRLRARAPKNFHIKREDCTAIGILLAPQGTEDFVEVTVEPSPWRMEVRRWNGTEEKSIPLQAPPIISSDNVEGVISWGHFGAKFEEGRVIGMAIRHYPREKSRSGSAYPSPENRRRAFRDAPLLLRLSSESPHGKISGLQNSGDAGFPYSDFIPLIDVRPEPLAGAKAAMKSSAELSIPWKTLSDLGLKTDQLRLSSQMLSNMGKRQDDVRRNFARGSFDVKRIEFSVPEQKYTIRMHFATLDDASSQDMFDVAIQGKSVLKGLNVAKEAGGTRHAIIKEFKGIVAGGSLEIELIPSKGADSSTILNGLEVIRE